jgi:2-keto-4-pentenoate hydratase/2-oxohepta-3-ene-1,7-dioic acid hydratase in catechol pathway
MKIICVGRNYAKHIDELQNERPDEPVLFMKPDSAVLPNKNPLYLPPVANEFHYEVELIIKINRLGKFIEPQFAHRYYDEIGLGIDITARDLQKQLKAKGLPWEKAKAFHNSAVVSPVFLPKTRFENLNDISFSLQKNGKTVQQGNTAEMLWKTDELIAYISTFFMLKKGDLIFTGTPAGVGKMEINDEFTGFIENTEMFRIRVKG